MYYYKYALKRVFNRMFLRGGEYDSVKCGLYKNTCNVQGMLTPANAGATGIVGLEEPVSEQRIWAMQLSIPRRDAETCQRDNMHFGMNSRDEDRKEGE